MNQDQQKLWNTKYRGRFLLFVTDAWGARREAPSDLGMLMDRHLMAAKQLFEEVCNDLAPAEQAPTLKVAK